MKQILCYTHPDHSFDERTEAYIKIQIDNGSDFGWDSTNTLFFTNFPYEYNGMKSIEIPDIYQGGNDPKSNKVPVIAWAIENGYISDGVYWFHENDAFQEKHIELDIDPGELAISRYKPKIGVWQCGSYFFRPSNLFRRWADRMRDTKKSSFDAMVLSRMVDRGEVAPPIELDVLYNLTERFLRRDYREGDPFVLHFHPHLHLNAFKGENKSGKKIISDRLLAIFEKHGIK